MKEKNLKRKLTVLLSALSTSSATHANEINSNVEWKKQIGVHTGQSLSEKAKMSLEKKIGVGVASTIGVIVVGGIVYELKTKNEYEKALATTKKEIEKSKELSDHRLWVLRPIEESSFRYFFKKTLLDLLTKDVDNWALVRLISTTKELDFLDQFKLNKLLNDDKFRKLYLEYASKTNKSLADQLDEKNRPTIYDDLIKSYLEYEAKSLQLKFKKIKRTTGKSQEDVLSELRYWDVLKKICK